MPSPPDRRVATLVVATVALVFAILVASVPKPERSTEAVLRDLVGYLVRSDHRTARVDSVVRRVTDSGRRLDATITTWFRDEPYAKVVRSAASLEVETSKGRWQCTNASGRPTCLAVDSSPSGVVRTDSSLAFFAAVSTTRRYTLDDGGSRRIAGERAQCFVLTLRPGFEGIVGLGRRVDLCFAADGIVLYSRIDKPGGTDTRTAVRVSRAVDPKELRAAVRALGDASVRGV